MRRLCYYGGRWLWQRFLNGVAGPRHDRMMSFPDRKGTHSERINLGNPVAWWDLIRQGYRTLVVSMIAEAGGASRLDKRQSTVRAASMSLRSFSGFVRPCR